MTSVSDVICLAPDLASWFTASEDLTAFWYRQHLQPEPEQAAEMQEASALEQEYDKLEQEYDKLFQELSQQESSTPLEWEDSQVRSSIP